MSPECKRQIARLIEEKIKQKLDSYESETTYTPFFSAIFDDEAIVMASLMQSLYTTFGMSIYEQMAVILAKEKGWVAERQYKLRGQIDPETEVLIEKLARSPEPNKQRELEMIRASIKPSVEIDDHEGVVDVYIRRPDSFELFVDITTVKPNLKEFKVLRRKMLRWAALRMSVNKNAKVDTRIGIPYNPYYPADYSRWTGSICDPNFDMLVQDDLWAAFAGENVFHEIIEVFKEVGERTKKEVRDFISNKSRNI